MSVPPQTKIDPALQIGGFSLVAWVVIQVIGNSMHPKLPSETTEAMRHIAHHSNWVITHVLLLFDYVVLVPAILGILKSFKAYHWYTIMCMPLLTIAISAGVVQVAIHPTVLKVLSDSYTRSGTSIEMQGYLVALYDTFWSYNIGLETGHLLIIYFIVCLMAIAMLSESLYRRWVAWLGIAAGVVAMVALVVGVTVFQSSPMGVSIIFGAGLLPLAFWVLKVGFVLIKAKNQG